MTRSNGQERIQRARNPRRPGAERRAGHGQRLGAHAARLQGRHFVRAPLGRLGVPPGAGGRAEHAAQLHRRGPEAHGRLRGRGDRHHRAVAGEGPAVRDAGQRHQGDRLGRRPRHLSDPAEAAHHGVPARGGAPAPAHQHDRRGDAGAAHAGAGDPPLLRRERLFLGQHADHHVVRRGGRGRAVPGVDARSRQPAAHAGRQGRFRQGFLRPRGVPDRVGAAQRRGLLPGADQGLHLRADVPRRELQHQPASRGVLDDRAGDRLRRPRRRRDAGGGAVEVHLRDAAEGAARRSRLLRRAHREGAGGEA